MKKGIATWRRKDTPCGVAYMFTRVYARVWAHVWAHVCESVMREIKHPFQDKLYNGHTLYTR